MTARPTARWAQCGVSVAIIYIFLVCSGILVMPQWLITLIRPLIQALVSAQH